MIDLANYQTGQIGLRWRVRNEVITGKGQITCGSISCTSKIDLHSYEVPFQYIENNETKLELVKVRLCSTCSPLLYYYHISKQKAESDAQATLAAAAQLKETRKRKKQKIHKSEGQASDTIDKDEIEVIENPNKKEAVIYELSDDEA